MTATIQGTKTAALGLGQRYIWLRHHQVPAGARHDAHIVTRFPLPPGLSVPQVRTVLGHLIRRHEALRTTYHHDADTDPWQRVHPAGPVRLVEATVESDGTPTPAAVVEELTTAAFDLAADWQLRACVITDGGAPRQLVLVLNHMAFDAWSVDRFERELEVLGTAVATRRPASLDPVRFQPLHLVGYESADTAFRSRRERAAAFWRDQVARLGPDPFAARRSAGAMTPHAATVTSPSALAASRVVAERAGSWPSLVHVALFSALTAAYTGDGLVRHWDFHGNRGEDAYSDVLTCRFSPLLTIVDGRDDPPFSELLRRVAEQQSEGRAHAALGHDEMLETLARQGAARGTDLRVGVEVNFLSLAAHEARVRRTTFVRNAAPSAWAAFGSDAYLLITELRDAVSVSLRASGTVMDAETVERLLRGYETVLLALAEPGADPRMSEIAAMLGLGEPGERIAVPDGGEPVAGSPEALHALLAAVAQAMGSDVGAIDPDRAFVANGGRVLRLPRVLDLLCESGFEGLRLLDLAGATPLRTLADQLSRIRSTGATTDCSPAAADPATTNAPQ
ncbi:MAG: hypothetical protein AUG49_17140 [Catenulispora sp. 13_1_20CM_3_70_7]|nr:hypothetical protein [Catenulisporales bacterium]OLE23080.1 MAG: hypothetical protein AUG49_17140 [Catenulispora sp. 13_1_20CM_3_70_7]